MKKKRTVLILLFALIFVLNVVFVTACVPAKRPGPIQPDPATPVVPTPVAPTQDNATAQDLAKKISEMKEINSATVILSGNQAWIGVDMAAKTESEMTDAMKNKITTLVKKEDEKLMTVYVTADADTFTRLENIAKDIASGKPLSGFVSELNEIGRRITPSIK